MSKYKEIIKLLDSNERIDAMEISRTLNDILKDINVPNYYIAKGLGIDEKYFLQIKNNYYGSYTHDENINSLERLIRLVDFAEDTLSKEGVKEWLEKPNPNLGYTSPILYLRSDEEMEKVLSLLGAIGHGLPA